MPKSLGRIFHWQPVLFRNSVAFRACRRLVVRGAPAVSGGGNNGSISCH